MSKLSEPHRRVDGPRTVLDDMKKKTSLPVPGIAVIQPVA
jgi:hypothetical protein